VTLSVAVLAPLERVMAHGVSSSPPPQPTPAPIGSSWRMRIAWMRSVPVEDSWLTAMLLAPEKSDVYRIAAGGQPRPRHPQARAEVRRRMPR
jgi:hypothetical protein